ncbi:MAG: hypothetical protein JNK49_00200 [Planctomycetes bacterium]|nr:hypothetical protein [Planctomycetota bacterium]
MAAPHPDQEFERLQRACQKGLGPVVVVTGTNDHYRRLALELLLAAQPQDAELRLLDAAEDRGARGGGDEGAKAPRPRSGEARDDGDDGEPDDGERGGTLEPAAESVQDVPELLDLRGGGLFARATVVCVRRGAKWWQRCAPVLATQLDKIARGSRLLLEANKLDKRRKVASELLKTLGEAVFEFRDLFETRFGGTDLAEGELVAWVGKQAQKRGVPLQPDAALLVVAQVGKGLSELAAELDRLQAQFGPDPQRKPLAPTDLRGRLSVSFESTPFELAEAVLDGDRARALRSVRAMCDRGVRGKTGKRSTGGVLPFACSWLWQSLAKVLAGRELLDAGVRQDTIARQLGVQFFADRFLRQVARHDAARLRTGLLAIHHCLRLSRTTGEDDGVLLEGFLQVWFHGGQVPGAEAFEW